MRVKRELVQRVTITGPVKDRAKAFDYCAEHGLRATFYGPSRLHQPSALLRFRLVAERRVGSKGDANGQ